MRKLTFILAAVTALTFTACKKKEQAAGGGTGTAAGTAAGTGTAGGTGTGAGTATTPPPAPAGELTGENKAGNCPSAVVGAETKVVDDKDQPGKVVLTITATESAASETIRRRIAHLLEVQGAPDAEIKHTGEGTGGAQMGMCPVITTKDTKITASDIEGGTKVVIEPTGGQTPEDLRKEVEQRITKTQEWLKGNLKGTDASGGGGGTGGGKGEHGGNHSGDGDGKGKEEKAGGAGTGTGAKSQSGGNTM
ncbi:MAG TPA: hypothetical protein VM734_23550 [Kofleriaceae bacterium]|nr:hypothetical protein [Kofleriaceae bacterium]